MKLYQITEEDLACLEQDVPVLTANLGVKTTNADRIKIRRIREIISNVRWNYQPHSGQEEIPTEQGPCDAKPE